MNIAGLKRAGEEKGKGIDLSIIIISWNDKKLLRNCLRSIHAQVGGITFETIVVDNGSEDGTAEMIGTEFPSVNLIVNAKNVGFARANNQGVELSKGRYVLFLNPDTLVVSPALQRLVKHMDFTPEVGAAGCKLINPDGTVQNLCARTFPTPQSEFYMAMMLTKIFPRSRTFSDHVLSYWDHNDSREIDCLSGAFLMVRKKVLDEVGSFDERFFIYAEDTDLCYRIKKAGWQLYYMSYVKVIHYGGQSTRDINFAVLQRASLFKFMNVHYGLTSALLFRVLTCIGAIIRILLIFPGLVLTALARRKRESFSLNALRRHTKILKWTLGLESWLRQGTPANKLRRYE